MSAPEENIENKYIEVENVIEGDKTAGYGMNNYSDQEENPDNQSENDK